MGLSRTTYESILKEYDEMRLRSSQELESRKAAIYRSVPELSRIEEEITSLQVKRASLRLHAAESEGLSESDIKTEILRLRELKAQLLENAGYSDEDFKPHYNCTICNDTGYDPDNRICSCFKSKIIERLYDFSHIRDILNIENFNTFNFKYYSDEEAVTKDGRTQLGVAKDAVHKAIAFVRGFADSADNLYICGDTGVGKTFLTNCIAREIIEQGHSVIYLSSGKFFDILADAAFGRQGDSELTAGWIYDCDLLIIDDLGTELTNSFVQTRLFDCINERFLRRKHTVISSNLSINELRDSYSERVASRVASNYTVIKLFAKDIRIQKALEVN